jgi:tripeptide aminopeptidase
VKMCYVFDCSKRPGTFIQSAVGCWLFTATFIGRSSHAAVAPEKGINAIHMAAMAMSKIRIGRLSATMTSNLGVIAGGDATNVVPAQCQVQGEVREFVREPIMAYLDEVNAVFRATAIECGGELRFETREDFAPFRLQREDPVVRVMEEALRAVGLDPHPIEYLGGSDANMLNAKAIPSVNLGIGAQNPHGDDEFILIEDLHKTAEIASALIERSATIL